MSVPLLEARDVTMRFGGVTAVRAVSMQLQATELRCLIGPNGAGKSTFFKVLTGQLSPTEGTILLNGQDVTGANRLVGQLAHGQRQWVEIATVLAQEPELILLDEPAAGMNHTEVLRTAELIRDLNRTQALVVVEHDMQFIRMIASTVTVFNQGAVLMEDDVAHVLADQRVRDVYLGKQAA